MTQCGSIPSVSVQAPGAQRPVQRAVHRHSADYRGDIDGLRGVAVALVVLFHVVGVDVFFVISGFLRSAFLNSVWMPVRATPCAQGRSQAAERQASATGPASQWR